MKHKSIKYNPRYFFYNYGYKLKPIKNFFKCLFFAPYFLIKGIVTDILKNIGAGIFVLLLFGVRLAVCALIFYGYIKLQKYFHVDFDMFWDIGVGSFLWGIVKYQGS